MILVFLWRGSSTRDDFCAELSVIYVLTSLNVNPTKWSNTLEQFVGKLFECVLLYTKDYNFFLLDFFWTGAFRAWILSISVVNCPTGSFVANPHTLEILAWEFCQISILYTKFWSVLLQVFSVCCRLHYQLVLRCSMLYIKLTNTLNMKLCWRKLTHFWPILPFYTPLKTPENPTKRSNTLKEFIRKSRRIIWVCLTILWEFSGVFRGV